MERARERRGKTAKPKWTQPFSLALQKLCINTCGLNQDKCMCMCAFNVMIKDVTDQ